MKHLGKVISQPVKEVTEGMQVLTISNKIRKIKKIHSKTVVEVDGIDVEINSLKTLVVEYKEKDSFTSSTFADRFITKQLPLKYSQWQAVIDEKIVDDMDYSVEFEIKDMDYPNRVFEKIAKIIPPKKKMYGEEEIPFEAISACLDYCEEKQIYDKLGNYGDFYYKLKKFFDQNKR